MVVVAVDVDDMAKLMGTSRCSFRRLLDVSIVCRCNKDVCCCLPTAVITGEDNTVFEEANAAVRAARRTRRADNDQEEAEK